MQADHIAARQQLGQRHILHTHGHTGRVGCRVGCQQRAAKTGHQLAKGFAYAAGAHHTHGAAMYVKTQQTVQRKVALTHTGIGTVDFAVQRQQQGQRVLGHGMGRILGHTAHGNAKLLRSYQVHLIEACAAQHHQAHTQAAQAF